jgi:hypothetical protein
MSNFAMLAMAASQRLAALSNPQGRNPHMPIATIRPIGDGLYHIHVLEPTDPGYGRPGGGLRPDQGLPGWPGHPDQGLPWQPGHPDQGLPGRPPHVGNRPPGSGGGGIPDHELPDTPPPQVAPGYTLVMIRDAQGKWHYAALAPGSAPPRPLPPIGGGGHPDQGLPGMPPHVSGQPIPGQPPVAGQPLPPTPAPKPA